jgi:glycosyltransferase involved in cell wall biosynthesis
MAIYHGFDTARLELAIESVRLQIDATVEVCVAESNPRPTFAERANEMGLRYAFLPADEVPNPGRVRNGALAIASGEFVYSTDADVLLPPGYIAALLRLPPQVWMHPPKRRLPKSDFAAFQERVRESGLPGAIASLWRDDYFLSAGGPLQYCLTEKDSKRYTCLATDHAVWKSSPAMRDRAPEFWDSTTHRGGTFALRSLWLAVGGYAEEYRAWGYEDADLQWKLGMCATVGVLPVSEDLRVLHLDHPKTYFSPAYNLANKLRFEARKAQPQESIANDRLRFEAAQS